jgi:hypothetical protein
VTDRGKLKKKHLSRKKNCHLKRSSLFWDVMQSTDVLGQPIAPFFKDQTVIFLGLLEH